MRLFNPNRFTTNTTWLLLRNIVCIVAGILLWRYPDTFANGVVIGAGILLVFYGLLAFLLSRFRRSIFVNSGTVNAIVSLAVGLAFILAPTFFAHWFITVVAILLIVLSVLQLMEVISLRHFRPSASVFLFFSPLILLAVGIVVLLKPGSIINLAGYFCAGALIYTGLSGIALVFGLRSAGKQAAARKAASAVRTPVAPATESVAAPTETTASPVESNEEEVKPQANE